MLQGYSHLLTRGQGQLRTVLFIESTLTVDTVERTHLAVGRQQVDAQRKAEAPTVDRAEDG